MDSPDKVDDSKAAFRKPSSDTANRKYRRRSSTSRSPPPGSPERRGYGSQNASREDSLRINDDDGHKRQKDNREHNWTSGRNSKSGESDRYDRASFRGSQGYKRHVDGDRDQSRFPVKTGNDSRDSRYRDSDRMKNVNQYAHTRYIKDADGHKSKHTEGRSSSLSVEKDMYAREKDDHYENRGSRTAWEDNRTGRSSYDKKGFDYREVKMTRDRDSCGSRVDNGDESGYSSRRPASPLKKPKLTNLDKSCDLKTSEPSERTTTVPNNVDDHNTNNLDAAKVAALRAAELVNKNLVGVGVVGALSTDQKKKLLWGSKKKAVEESGHCWDASLFPDREQQEKFNRLMNLRLPWCLWQIVGCEGRGQDGTEVWKSRGKEYPRPRETEGTTTRFRETIHRWTQKERWPHSRPWPLSFSSWHHPATEAKHFRSSSVYVCNDVPPQIHIFSSAITCYNLYNKLCCG